MFDVDVLTQDCHDSPVPSISTAATSFAAEPTARFKH
jgi:hypothetical protein